MGIHDRDYYREDDDGPSSWTRYGQVTKLLIVVTVVAFVIQLITPGPQGPGGDSGGPFTEALELVGNKVLSGQVWRLVTCGFLHSTKNPLHILFNMFFLWLVGRELEERHGSREFLAFYLLALIVSSLAFVGASAVGLNQTSLNTPALGASGAVTAALILFILHAPHRRILFFFVIPMPIWLLGVIFVGHDVVSMFVSDPKDGERIAVSAHLGGAAFGALYFLAKMRITGWLPKLSSGAARRAQPRLRVRRDEDDDVTETPEYSPPAPPKADPDVDEHLEAQLDAVLAKVAKHGQESLTPSERAVLHRASEVYRRRRR